MKYVPLQTGPSQSTELNRCSLKVAHGTSLDKGSELYHLSKHQGWMQQDS